MQPLLRSTVAFLGILLYVAGLRAESLAEGTSPEQLVREGKYVEAIRSLDQAWRAAGRLSPEDMKTYLEAYYLHGEMLLKNGDLTNAKACFSRVISLDRRHADSHFQLGMLEKQAKNYQKALPYLRSAISLASQHSPEANAAVIEIGQECLSSAEKAMEEGDVQAARTYLNFVSTNFLGEGKNRALELITYRLTALSQAASEYARATQLLAVRSKPEAMRILREIAKTYPDTFFARKANQSLEELGERVVVPQTSTGLKLPATWKRKETPYFEVYYEKEIYFNRLIPQAEKVLPEIFASFGYFRPNWTRKCRIYLFSTLSDWRGFLETNKGRTLEWSNAFATEMELYLYVERDTSHMLEHTLPHELTHVVHRSIVGASAHTPLWFTEGLAVNHEQGRRDEARRTLRLLRRAAVFIPLFDLLSMPTYPAEQEKIRMFYLESAALLDILAQKFGPAKVREMALVFKNPVSTESALKTVLNITTEDLEKLWKRYIE